MALSSVCGRHGEGPLPLALVRNPTAASAIVQARLSLDACSMANIQVDWKETTTEHVFMADLPGVRKEDVRVAVNECHIMKIIGFRKREEVQKTDKWNRMERSGGRFMRQFWLPENTNLEAITAKVDTGVLTVVVPKLQKRASLMRFIAIA